MPLLTGCLLVVALGVARLCWVVGRERRWRPPMPAEPADEVANYGRLRAALTRLRPPADRELPIEDWSRDPLDDPALPAARRFVDANIDALAEVRAALALPCWQPRDDSVSSENTEEMAALRGLTVLSSLLRQEALVAWADRDWNGAVEPLFDGLRLAQAVGRSGEGRGLLAGACATVYTSCLALLTPRLEAGKARAVVRRLEEALTAWPSPGEQVRREALSNAGMVATPGLSGAGPGLFEALLRLPGPCERHRRAMAFLEALATAVEAPRCQWRLPSTAALTWGAAMADLVVGSAEFRHRQTVTLRVLLAQAAVEAYRLDRGHYPERLDELVPEFLATVPDDGYVPGPLRYRRTADSFVCWSVGPDLVDDGGTPLVKPDWPDMAGPPPPLSEWKGDVVSSNASAGGEER